jgi:acyl-CoA thioester hydrolase
MMTDKWPDLAGRIENNRHVLAARVYYEDTDFSGYVYHANYLRFCERGRSDCLRLAGVHHKELFSGGDENQLGFVVRQMNCEFKAPAVIDDLLEIYTAIASVKGARMVLEQQVICKEKVLFEATVMAALVDGRGKPRRFSDEMLKAFSRLG